MLDHLRCASAIFIVIGIGFIVGGTLLFVLGKSIIKTAVKNECQLKEGTLAYNNWHDPPVPYYISIYIFHLENTEFLNGLSKPRLKQRGPFVYKEERKKIDIREYENETMSYRETRSYTFDSSRSAEPETVNITTFNLVYMTLVNYLRMENTSSIFRRIVGELLSVQEEPVMQLTAKEYIWGYRDELLHTLKIDFPEIITDDQVSAFNAAIDSAGTNVFLINNGVGLDANSEERINDVGNIERFNFESTLSYWSNKYANMINGTDSTLWHPDVSKTERLYAFFSDICRSVYLEFDETYDNRFSIKAYRYKIPNSVFASSSTNKGFCLNTTTANKSNAYECLSNGLFSLKTCIHLSGSSVAIPLPIIGSNPHFLGADPSLLSAVIGLNPDEIHHRSFVDVEPITGMVVNGSRRLQINLNVINDSAISDISLINPFVYPMIWIDEHAEIDQSNAHLFHKKVTTPILAINIIKYAILVIGVVLLIIAIVLVVYHRRQTNTTGPPFPKSSTDETSPLLF